jgi:hypothetical protein
MNAAQILDTLMKERALLEDFICLSGEQLLLLEDEDLTGFDGLLQRRADLMIELTTVENTLGKWINRIQHDQSVTPGMMEEFRAINDEIVSMANHIVAIDEEAHARLDRIKQQTHKQIQSVDKRRRDLRGTTTTATPPPPRPKLDP